VKKERKKNKDTSRVVDKNSEVNCSFNVLKSFIENVSTLQITEYTGKFLNKTIIKKYLIHFLKV
jgi:hypothetical protein